MADVKTATAKTPNAPVKAKNSNGFFINLAIVVVCVVIGFLLFNYVLGDPSNFSDADKKNPVNFLGNMFHAGNIIA